MKKRLPLLLIILVVTNLSVSAQAWLWGAQGSTGKKTDLFAKNVATNPTGNVYHTGGFETSLTFGSTTLTSQFEDAYLVKYDEDGNMLWAKQSITSSGSATGYSVATNDADEAFVTGNIGQSTSFGSYTLTNYYDCFLVKYDANGNVVWATQPANGPNTGIAVAVDKFNHEYVTGTYCVLSKCDKNGNVLWTVTPRLSSLLDVTEGYSLATDNSGNIYMSGQFVDSLVFSNNVKLYDSVGQFAINTAAVFIAKFDSNGNVLWAKQSYKNPQNLQPFGGYGSYSVATDQAGAAYLTGTFSDSIMFGSYTLQAGFEVQDNFFVVKFNPGGSIAWAKTTTSTGSPSSGCGTFSINSDNLNHLYISGAEGGGGLGSSSFVFSYDTINLVGANGSDIPSFVMKLDTAGNVLCDSSLTGGGEYPNAVAADSSGKFVYMGGGFVGTLTIGSNTLNDVSGGYNTFVGRWNPCLQCNLTATVTPSSAAICNGKSVGIKAGGGTNYTWSPSTGLNTTTGDTVVANPTTTTTYIVSASNSGGCLVKSTVVVIVNPDPVITASPNPSSYCPGGTTILSAFGGNTYTWSPSTSLTATVGSSVIANPSVTTTYTATGTTTATGCSSTGNVVVIVNPVPDIKTLANPPAYCIGGSSILTASGGNSYTWLPSGGLSGTTGSSVTADPIVTTNYVVVGIDSNGCTGETSVSVTITSALTVTATPNPASYCPGDSSVLTAFGANSYTWSPSTNLSDTTGSSVVANPTVTTTYTVIGTDGSCGAATYVIVTIIPPPYIYVNPAAAICPGASAVLSLVGGTGYTWSPSTGLSATTGGEVTATPAVTTVYTITVATLGCATAVTDTVIIDSVPPLRILPQPPPVLCPVINNDTLRVASQGTDFTWSPSEGLSATTGVRVIANPSVSVTYTVTGIDSLGCHATGTEPVTILQIINKPTFYQNGDTLISSAKKDNQWYHNDTILLGDTSEDLIITATGYYYDIINNEANGCSTSSDTVNITQITGINQLSVESGQVTVYPNPFNNEIFVKINSSAQDVKDWTMQLTDVLGRQLYSIPSLKYSNEIDLSDLVTGMYFITVINKTERLVVPMVKE